MNESVTKLIPFLNKPQVIIVSADPTRMDDCVTDLINHVASDTFACFVYLMMGSTELTIRNLLEDMSGVSAVRIKRGYVEPNEWPTLQKAADVLSNRSLFFSESPFTDIEGLRSEVLSVKEGHAIIEGVIIVDHIEMLGSFEDADERHNQLQAVAKDTNLPLVLFCRSDHKDKYREVADVFLDHG